jgi:hypothetical protein
MLRSFNPKYMLFCRVRNIAFRRALAMSTEQYQSALIVGMLCWPLNRMPCLPELYYSEEILFRNFSGFVLESSTGVGPWTLWYPWK